MLFDNTHFLIPARRGSKGLPKKNQLLLDYTISKIPVEYHDKIIVSTDDEYIIKNLKMTGQVVRSILEVKIVLEIQPLQKNV